MKYTFEDFDKLVPVKSYELIGFRADLVMKDRTIKVSKVYLSSDQINHDVEKFVVNVDEHLQLSEGDIEYVVLKYISDVKYDREGTTEVVVSGIYAMYSGINGYTIDNGHDTHYLSDGISPIGVLVRDIDNLKNLNYAPTYNDKDLAKHAFGYKIYITISQAFTPWGVIPMMYITGGQMFTIFGDRLFPITVEQNIYSIAETELTISIDNEEDIAAAAEAGIRMFDEWAYDYSFFIEPIRKHFAK